MRRLCKKLNSERGVSMLVALLFFLVAFMVTVVILDASVTTVKRLSHEHEQEQDYLTVTSAARLFRQCLRGSSVTITETTTTKTSEDGDVAQTKDVEYSPSGDWGSILQKIVKDAYEDDYPPTSYKSADYVARVHVDDENLSDGVLTFYIMAESGNDKDIIFDYKLEGVVGVDDSNSTQVLYITDTHLKGGFVVSSEEEKYVVEGEETIRVKTIVKTATLRFGSGVNIKTVEE